MEAEVAVICLQAKGCQKFLTAIRSKGTSLRASIKNLLTSGFQTSGLHNCEKVNFFYFKPKDFPSDVANLL
jgi:hypothetical protein